MRIFPGDSLRDFGAKLDMQFDSRSKAEWEDLVKAVKQVDNEHTFAFAHRCKNLFEFLAIDDGGRGRGLLLLLLLSPLMMMMMIKKIQDALLLSLLSISVCL